MTACHFRLQPDPTQSGRLQIIAISICGEYAFGTLSTLFAFLFAFLAAFLTAVVSFLKQVHDKEGKITDFREQWTTSARQA